ncbi:hypothetical protein HY572_03585 [Candidatus Micrarchaeota archaeon]|nr:hypothetical protein [Candidatus Micrarchaeota archaeon]
MANQQLVLYASLAVILLVVLGSAFYTFSQVNGLKNQVATLQTQVQEANSLLVNQQQRLQAVESQLSASQVTGKVVLFYDSDCVLCDNAALLSNIDQTRQALLEQRIGLELVDVKDNANPALAAGVKHVPTFFSSSSDLAVNPRLVEFMNSLVSIRFSLQETAQGVYAFPPLTGQIISTPSCSVEGEVKLEEFYSPTCAFCRPVFYDNGTQYNNASLDARFSVLSGDAAKNASAEFGAKLDLRQRCVAIHSLEENRDVLNVSKSDEALCIEEVGADAFDENEKTADRYGVYGAPLFVVDCQYTTSVRESDKLKQAICQLHSELCGNQTTA